MEYTVLQQVIEENPFNIAANEGKFLHCHFFAHPSLPKKLKVLDDLLTETEQDHLSQHALYFYAPEGVGRAKAAKKIERALAVETTARNWNTILKLNKIAAELPS